MESMAKGILILASSQTPPPTAQARVTKDEISQSSLNNGDNFRDPSHGLPGMLFYQDQTIDSFSFCPWV